MPGLFLGCGLNCFHPISHTSVIRNYLSNLTLLNSPKLSALQEVGILSQCDETLQVSILSFYSLNINALHFPSRLLTISNVIYLCEGFLLFSPTCQVELMLPGNCIVLYFGLPLINASMRDCEISQKVPWVFCNILWKTMNEFLANPIFLWFLNNFCAIEKLIWPGPLSNTPKI